MSKKTSGYVKKGLAIFGGLYLTVLATLWLAAPRNALSGCNPPDFMEDCCISNVTVICDNAGSITGSVTNTPSACLDGGTGTVELTCSAGHTGAQIHTNITYDPIAGTGAVCPSDVTLPPVTVIFPLQYDWILAGPGLSTNGSGPVASAPVTNCGQYTVTFTVTTTNTAPCPPVYKTFTATQAVSGVKIDIPDLIGVNDYVRNCFDPAGYPFFFVTNSVEFYADTDLKDITWSVCPADDADDGNVTITSLSPRLRVLAIDYDGNFITNPIVFPLDEPPLSIKIEGIDYSLAVGDAPVLISYDGCTASDSTTVVRVLLDKFNYNRADPFPEVQIVSLGDFYPGKQVQTIYKILGDVLDPEQVFTDTYQVTDQIGTWEYKTPDFTNRIGNIGWDTVRYTVFDNGDALGIRWEHADPSHARMAAMPDPAMMDIEIKDATAETPEQAYGHLAPIPSFAGTNNLTIAETSSPHFKIPEVKVFAATPAPAYTNELSPAVGNEKVLMTLLGVSQDSAVVLEIEGTNTVGVNDRFVKDDGDPGYDASVDRDPDDPDFIRLDLDGVPGCIVKGTVTWSVLDGDIRLVSSDASQIGATVTTNFTAGFLSEFLYVKVEGLAASDAIDDCHVRVEIQLDPGDVSGNPPAFQGQTLSAEYKLTVTDLRWIGWKADDASGKTPERTDMLACDLDLRPAARIDYPDAGSPFIANNIVTVSGVARSMVDIVRDIRVNGQPIPQTNIFFLGQTVSGMTETSVRELTDRPPPYEVTFAYDLELDETQSIRVEARNGIGAWPGTAERTLTLVEATPPATGSVVESVVDLASDPAYDLPDMTNFFDQGWAFLYKTEVDHRGAGKAVVDCYEKAGVQPDGGLFRLRQPVIFIDKYGYNDAIPGPGLFIDYEQEVAPITYTNGATTGMRKLFPIELTVSDSAGIVSNAIEWTHGALLMTDSTDGTLTIELPDPDNDLPADATITLSVADVAGQPNPFADFETITYEDLAVELPATITLDPASTPGVAAFEVVLHSGKYGVLAKDRVKVSATEVEVVWVPENVSPDSGMNAAGQSELPPPLEGGPGEPGGVGGFGGPPVGSGFTRLATPFAVTGYEYIPGDEFAADHISLSLVSTTSDWSTNYTLTASGQEAVIFTNTTDSIAMRRINGLSAIRDAKGTEVETVIISSMAFGATRSLNLYRPRGTNTFESERLNLSVAFASALETNAVDTVDVVLTSSLMSASSAPASLVETGEYTGIFQDADKTLELRILRMSDFGSVSPNDFTASVTSERLNLHNTVIDVRETEPGSHQFSSAALSTQGQGQPGTATGASSFLPLGAIWIPRIGVSKPGDKPIFPRCWQETKLEASIARIRDDGGHTTYPTKVYWSKDRLVAPPPGAAAGKQFYALDPLRFFLIYDETLGADLPVFSDVDTPSWLPFLPDVITFSKARGGDKFKAWPPACPNVYDEITVITVELHIDSDNNAVNYVGLPSMLPEEYALRNIDGHPGKALFLNELDTDKDGVPDFLDGYDIEINGVNQEGDSKSARFVPLKVKIPSADILDYSLSTLEFSSDDPTVFSEPSYNQVFGAGTHGDPYSYHTDGRKIRLWAYDGNIARSINSIGEPGSGSWVPPDTPITINSFPSIVVNSDGTTTITLYIEAVAGSQEIGDVKIRVKLNPGGEMGDSYAQLLTDEVQATVFHIESVRPIAEDFVTRHEGKIMISTKHCTPETPNRVYTSAITTKDNTPAQYHNMDGTHNTNVTATAYIKPIPPDGITGFPALKVYFEVTDPDDRSPYDGKIEPTDPTNNWPNDNRDRDSNRRMDWGADGKPRWYLSYQGACLTVREATATLASIDEVQRYAAETVLKPTDRYAGDNYQVRATLRRPDSANEGGRFDTHTGMNTNNAPYQFHASTIKQTIPLVSWKRVYIEQDHMYTLGATIISNAPAGETEVYVDSNVDLSIGDPVTLFWKSGGTMLQENGTVTNLLPSRIVLTQGISQPIPAYAGIKPQGHTATYELTRDFMPQAYGSDPQGADGGAFIEFRDAPTGNDTNGIPKYHVMPSADANTEDSVWISYCMMWYDNKADAINNVAYLVAANKAQPRSDGVILWGWNSPINGASIVFTQQSNGSWPMDFRRRDKTVVHELGHRFGLIDSASGAFSYIDTESLKLSFSGGAYCIMNYQSTRYDIELDKRTEFSIQCLIEGSSMSWDNSLRTTEDK